MFVVTMKIRDSRRNKDVLLPLSLSLSLSFCLFLAPLLSFPTLVFPFSKSAELKIQQNSSATHDSDEGYLCEPMVTLKVTLKLNIVVVILYFKVP